MAHQRRNNKNQGSGNQKPPEPWEEQPDWLKNIAAVTAADPAFQRGIGEIDVNWQDYIGNQQEARSRVKSDFGTTLREMKNQRGQDIRGIRGDYASRGMGFSGGLPQDINKYRNEWQNSREALEESRDRGFEDIKSGTTTQKLIRNQTAENLRLDAVRRRSQRLGTW